MKNEKETPYSAVLNERELLSRLKAWFDAERGAFPLTVTGSSMTPFVAPGRDTVYLYPYNGEVVKGDVILFRSSTGRLMLHRAVKTVGGIVTAGDAFTYRDPGYAAEIYAVCGKIKRKGRIYTEKSLFWLFFSKIWVNIIPLRGALLRIRKNNKKNGERKK